MSVVTPELIHVSNGESWLPCHRGGGDGSEIPTWEQLKARLCGQMLIPHVGRDIAKQTTLELGVWVDHWYGDEPVFGLAYYQQAAYGAYSAVDGENAYVLRSTGRVEPYVDDAGEIRHHLSVFPWLGRHHYWVGPENALLSMNVDSTTDPINFNGSSNDWNWYRFNYMTGWTSQAVTTPFFCLGYTALTNLSPANIPTGPDDMNFHMPEFDGMGAIPATNGLPPPTRRPGVTIDDLLRPA